MTIDPQRIGFVLALGVLVFLFLRSRGNISSAEARALVRDGARLVDVRSPGEFAAGHIDGALNLPVAEIVHRVGEIGPPDKPVVLYCASGVRSAAAARMLKSKGFADVRNLGAMSRW